ncbi:Alpha/beta hydrolase family protein [Nonomuraea coxensis DSM 45129]|uniref:Alpha/beta hydrolase family protein n=1 Tax=Nonomuraea coxensis DSM 45129 TaxID=1122611 RepID=A0ABX8U4W2_9ACTN|nr:alpha/beta fold hydrolase [Nonomuraea coxensis]QYC41683.1 Alpha/beta hydrolase family protein [Nonomuraea coxensis DSM 45129]
MMMSTKLHTRLQMGRQPAYVERSSNSSSIVIFLHGLGLDSSDYCDYLRRHDEQHSIAITLVGFEARSTISAGPIPLREHVETVSDLIAEIHGKYPEKKIVLAGFSLGADLILCLAEHWRENRPAAPRMAAALLLDPNVNQSTMAISKLFAEADPNDPLPAFDKLIGQATDPAVLEALRSYVAKVRTKDFVQLWSLSRDMLGYWHPDGYTQIGARLAAVAAVSDAVRVVLSSAYKRHLPAMRAAVVDESRISFSLTSMGHFDLIREENLSPELDHIR